jgi:hypothetical protein
MKKRHLALIALAIGLWTAMPPSLGAEKAPASPPKTIFILLDLSKSTNNDRESYIKDINMVIDSLALGDRLIVDKITDNPLSGSQFPINAVLPTFQPHFENERWVQGQRRKFDTSIVELRKKLKDDCKTILGADTSFLTDIFGSLALAERIFRAYPQGRHVLAVFSDMVHESKRYDFKAENLSPLRINQIISVERQQNRIPLLTAVKVYVAGANSTDTDRFQALRSFWAKYFEACGAILNDYGRSFLTIE